VIDKFQARAAKTILDRINGQPDGLCTLTDAELALVRVNDKRSSELILAAFLSAAGGDKRICERCIADACTLDADAIRAAASRAIEQFAARKSPNLSMLAALMLVGRAEHTRIEEEITRRETQRRLH
jgi:hypothetical protein